MKKSLLLLVIIFSVSTLPGQVTQQVKQMAYADSLRLVGIYKDLHQNPELAFNEVRTSGILAAELKKLGFNIIAGIGKTGIAGILKNGDGPVVMYRADMDGLPVKEQTGLAYSSTKIVKKDDGTETPTMHACGHDAHVTWLLGVAKIMVALKKEWKGTLVFIGQPAEETIQGAKAMVNDKMYERGVPVPDYFFGMHTWPIPVGTIQNGYKERFAGSDQLDVTFKGIGGHGSAPELAKDPVIMGTTAIMQYQTIISRNIAAQEPAVLTVGSFQAGTANNIIPPSALLKINLRWFNEKTRNTLIDGIKQINEGIAIANNLDKDLYPVLTMKGSAGPLINNDELVNKLNIAFAKIIAPENIKTNIPAHMGSEDFQDLLGPNKNTPYDYIMVGTANPELCAKAAKEGKKYPFYNHNSIYQVDLSAIPLGTLLGATALMEIFRK